MSETVKLIIEIPKETYLEIKSGFITRNAIASAEAIKNGVPLDDVKAEIEESRHITQDPIYAKGLETALGILDNIGKGE